MGGVRKWRPAQSGLRAATLHASFLNGRGVRPVCDAGGLWADSGAPSVTPVDRDGSQIRSRPAGWRYREHSGPAAQGISVRIGRPSESDRVGLITGGHLAKVLDLQSAGISSEVKSLRQHLKHGRKAVSLW